MVEFDISWSRGITYTFISHRKPLAVKKQKKSSTKLWGENSVNQNVRWLEAWWVRKSGEAWHVHAQQLFLQVVIWDEWAIDI